MSAAAQKQEKTEKTINNCEISLKISKQQAFTIAAAIRNDIRAYVDNHPDEYKAYIEAEQREAV